MGSGRAAHVRSGASVHARPRAWAKNWTYRLVFHPALVLALVCALILGMPGTALAQNPTTPLSPGLPQATHAAPTNQAPTTTTTPATTTTGSSTSTGGGLSSTDAAAIAVGAFVVLGGISFFIWRDARRRAPVRQAAMAVVDGRSRSGSKARAKPRKLSPAERRRRKRGRAR